MSTSADTSPAAQASDTPSMQLAKQIVDELVQAGLLSQKKGAQILPKLASGELTGEDWHLAIELSDEKETDE